MLTKAQCCRVDDQRGLLTKEQLEVPSFLQLPSDQEQDTDEPSTSTSTTDDSKPETEAKASSASSSAAAADKTADSASKDMRETTV